MNAEFEVGVVTAVDIQRHLCTVKLDNAASIPDVILGGVSGGNQSMEVSWLHSYVGSAALIVRVYNRWYMLTTLSMPADRTLGSDDAAKEYGVSASAGDVVVENISFPQAKKTKTLVSPKARSFKTSCQCGILPGDKLITADGHASLGVYMRDLVVMKASALSQIVMGGLKNFIKIVARELSIYTDFGAIEFTHGASGKTGMHIGGGQNLSENDPETSPYSVDMYVGDVPGNESARFGIQVRDGADTSALVMDNMGMTSIGGTKDVRLAPDRDVNVKAGRSFGMDIAETSLVKIGDASEVRIGADSTVKVNGTRTETVMGKASETVFADKDLTVVGTLNISAGGISFCANGSGSGECTVRCGRMNIVKGSSAPGIAAPGSVGV